MFSDRGGVKMKVAVILMATLAAAFVSPIPILQESGMSERNMNSGEALKSVLATVSDPRKTLIFITDATNTATSFLNTFLMTQYDIGISVFELVDIKNANVTNTQLSRLIGQARQVRRMSWSVTVVVVSGPDPENFTDVFKYPLTSVNRGTYDIGRHLTTSVRRMSRSVTVVVVSDDIAFLTAFTQLSSHDGRLLVWSTRLIAFTRLSINHHHKLHDTFSSMNAIIITINDSRNFRCNMFIYLPYTSAQQRPIHLATWTPSKHLVLTSHLPLFPDKYTRFLQRPTLSLATEAFHAREIKRDDSSGRNKDYTAEYLAQGMNFTYRYVHTPDGTFGSKQQDGSWSGMIGLVARREADFSTGPFSLSLGRAEVVDFTHPVLVQYNLILGGRGRPEVDPWGFYLPLRPTVWLALLISLFAVPTVLYILSYYKYTQSGVRESWREDTFTMIRVLLQQDSWLSGWEWWRRIGLAGWMLAAVVVVRSYAGNLMSVLAVRHIQQPYQSLRDVLDDPFVTMVWQTNTSNVQYYRSVESGVYKEVREAEEAGRVKHHTIIEYFSVINKMVRPGDHVLVDIDLMLLMMVGRDFSVTARCDFYTSREKFLPVMLSMIGQKDSPLVPALSKRMISLSEAGLYYQWIKSMVPNSTSCLNLPTRITVSTTLTLTNLSGMFAVLGGGYVIGLLILLLESITNIFTTTRNINIIDIQR